MKNKILRMAAELKDYPSAVFGLCIIFFLLALAAFSVLTISYREAVTLWRADVGIWEKTPRYARPAWFNWLPGVNRPTTFILNDGTDGFEKEVTGIGHGISQIRITLPMEFDYDAFPGEMTLFVETAYEKIRPWARLTWSTPDGRDIELVERSLRREERVRLSLKDALRMRLDDHPAHVGLFMRPEAEEPQVLRGRYRLEADVFVFEDDAEFDMELVVYGRLHGAAGTDHRRRSLAVALMWGTPVALAFAFLAAVGSTMTTMFIAAVGVWFGGIVDAAIQRLTEVNMILPALPILVMIGTLYSRSIWVMLSVIIILGIFSAAIKTYRAVFLQVKESPYIEAARAYGAGHFRILTRYMIPKVLPMLVPQFVVLIPSFVFLEATLAILGLGDPLLPTWGKVLNDAHQQDALLNGQYYWVLLPALLLMLTGFGFAMVGFALDRIFNPRLRKH